MRDSSDPPYSSSENSVLVALLKDPKDWQILLNHGIYRIRGTLKYPPTILTQKKVRIIGFYLPAIFGKHKFSVRHYAKVKSIKMAPRSECVPDEMQHSSSKNLYYKIDVEEPIALNEPIVSLRKRAYMTLIPTTEEKFFTAPELNFCFNGTKPEEKMWKILLDRNIFPEREYPVKSREGAWSFLDFALFCKEGKFSIEVDGPLHEANREAVVRDKHRDNRLSVEHWDGFRFMPEDLEAPRLEITLAQIIQKIRSLKGLATEGGLLPALPSQPAQQTLFHDEHLSYLELRKRVKARFEAG